MTPSPQVALIGAGLASRPHLAALRELGCEVPAVATRSVERLADVRQYFPSAQPCWPPEQIFENSQPDAVMVLSPPASHLDGVRLCASRGVPVVVEKPLEVSLDRARQLV